MIGRAGRKANVKLFEDRISSTVARVRIALALKGLTIETDEVSILGVNARTQTSEYRRVNPQGLVPSLLTDEGALLTQSLAIVEYLEERYPEPALLPTNLEARAQARAIALAITAEVHALLTPRVAARLRSIPGVDAVVNTDWNRNWMQEGLTSVEALLARQDEGVFCVGESPSVADIFLFPQAINTERAGISLAQWPRIFAIVTKLRSIPAFAENAPLPRT
jgi:maleylpyruvate isomerase